MWMAVESLVGLVVLLLRPRKNQEPYESVPSFAVRQQPTKKVLWFSAKLERDVLNRSDTEWISTIMSSSCRKSSPSRRNSSDRRWSPLDLLLKCFFMRWLSLLGSMRICVNQALLILNYHGVPYKGIQARQYYHHNSTRIFQGKISTGKRTVEIVSWYRIQVLRSKGSTSLESFRLSRQLTKLRATGLAEISIHESFIFPSIVTAALQMKSNKNR